MKKLWLFAILTMLLTVSACTEKPECFDMAKIGLDTLRSGTQVSTSDDVRYPDAKFYKDAKLYKEARNIIGVETCAAEFKGGKDAGLEALGTTPSEILSFKREALNQAMARARREEWNCAYVGEVVQFIQEIMKEVLHLSYDDMGLSEKDFEGVVYQAVLRETYIAAKSLYSMKSSVFAFHNLMMLVNDYNIHPYDIYSGTKVGVDYGTFVSVLISKLADILDNYPSEVLTARNNVTILPNDIKKWTEDLRPVDIVLETAPSQETINRSARLAYTRLAEKLVRDLRAGRYEYPGTKEVVEKLNGYLKEAGITLRDIGICKKELEDLIKANPVAKQKPNC